MAQGAQPHHPHTTKLSMATLLVAGGTFGMVSARLHNALFFCTGTLALHLPLPSLARTSEQNLATRTHTLAHTHTRAHTHMHTHTHTFSLSLSLSLSLSGRAWAWWAARVHGAPSSPLRLRQHVRLQQLRLRRTAVLLQPRRPWWHASLPVVIVVVIVHWNPHVNRFALCFKWWASKSRDEVLGSVCVCVRKSVSSCFLVATI